MNNLLPPNSTQFERQFSTAFARVSAVETPARTFNLPLEAPAVVLPWLAWERSVDDWKKSWTEAQKRQTINNAHYVHCHKGTIGALERALKNLGIQAVVQEWFNMSPIGQPYTFSIQIQVNQVGANEGQIKDLMQVINNNKNLRSHLVNTSLVVQSDSSPIIAAATLGGHEFEFTNAAGSLQLDGTWNLDGTWSLDGFGIQRTKLEGYNYLDNDFLLNGLQLLDAKRYPA